MVWHAAFLGCVPGCPFFKDEVLSSVNLAFTLSVISYQLKGESTIKLNYANYLVTGLLFTAHC